MTTANSSAREIAPLPEMNRANLARLRETGTFSRPAWEAAMAMCGFTPGKKEWRDYARHLLLLGGTLFLLAGVIFFVAWNWADMHRHARLGLVSLVVAATGLGAVWRGPDAAGGRVLLLACGIAVGPMLAVFGQTYQTGAELWELFRVWAAVLLALAIGGRQAALWFTAWLAGNVFVMLWRGRGMDSPLDAIGFFSVLPEFALALALALAVWEGAAWKLRGAARHAWLQSRWLPRLLFFDLSARLTAYLCIVILSHGWSFVARWHIPGWHIPHWPVMPVLYILVDGLSWYWHRAKTPDLFMPACSLASGAALLVCLLLVNEFLFDAGVSAFFGWGIIVVGLTAGIAKILLSLQRAMERDGRGKAHAAPAAPFFTARRALPSWEALWESLKRRSLLDAEAPLPAAAPPASPWYVRSMLALGGWIAAILFMAFIVLLLFDHMRIRSNEGLTLLLASLAPLGAAFSALRREGVFDRNFGFAMALAGTACACAGVIALFDIETGFYLPVAALIAALCVPMNSAAYRFAAAAAIVFLVPSGIIDLVASALAFSVHPEDMPSAFRCLLHGTTVWWAALGVGLAAFLLREGEWRGSGAGKALEPMFYGAFAGMMLYLIGALSAPLRFWGGRDLEFLFTGGFAVGAGAAAGLVFLAWRLVRERGARTERALVMGCAFLTLPLGYFLPGAGLAVFGLAVSRQAGSLVMQGAAGAFLFAYMVYYYYFLAVPLQTKSLLLAATGAALLGLAFALRASRLGLDETVSQAMEGEGHA